MRRVTLSLAAAAALIAAPLGATAAGAAGVSGLTADYAVSQSWSNGFQATYTVTNHTNATVNSWSLSFDLPTGESVSSLWNGTLTSTSTSTGTHYTVTSPSWAAPLAPGAAAPAVGFGVTTGAVQSAPVNCTINNQPCAGAPADTVAPSVPGSPRSTGTGPGSIVLGWTASTDNTAVAGYHVREGSTVVATVTGTSATVRGLLQGSSHTFTVSAFDAAGNESANSAAVTATAGTGTSAGTAAPYVDLGAYPTPSLPALSAASGIKEFSLAFIINGSQPCTASWFGAYDPATGWNKADMDAVRDAGGDVRPSFGGANGTELAQSCTTVAALAAQYQKVVDVYALDRVDFDIEGTAVTDHASVDRRSAALAQVQAAQRAKGRDLKVSLTLPVLPSGLTADGVYILQSAKNAGLAVDLVNVMAMDFGDWAAPSPAGKMGAYAIQSAQSTQAQIRSVWTNLTDAQAYAMVGVTPMLGQNDTTSEVFNISDAQQLLAFAQQNHLGELAFWEMTRDANACTGSLPKCTNVPQTPYQFSKIFAAYQG
ncbi:MULTISPECIES: cellulose binding domain-containing protein [Kitasatospora]|uniref:Putative glycoside hydrolase n=1 Tax=Kitasatospora setae (strain ATCC 33774 / DSM 43861 / JCM 3304 / KCC A-0304 / NBRC 14216 / KM-6054) TaxID=452652 RepID=E4N4V6_KITSK|nr:MULTISPECIES: cellulose binding domain-containing protein [Kitasatospora]BAJ26237.1 putative glycoside hydrolase [Kitasatospora setae KM-6054]